MSECMEMIAQETQRPQIQTFYLLLPNIMIAKHQLCLKNYQVKKVDRCLGKAKRKEKSRWANLDLKKRKYLDLTLQVCCYVNSLSSNIGGNALVRSLAQLIITVTDFSEFPCMES